ncbi:MAG: MarR family transcriptional regulator [Ilumatobacteraceae bacterium]
MELGGRDAADPKTTAGIHVTSAPAIDHFPVDLGRNDDLDTAVRLGWAWREIRRGGNNTVIGDYFFGVGQDALEYGQMDTLDVLISEPSWRMSDLAVALRVDPSTATRAVQRLVTPGLVERLTDREDGRVVIVRITDAGRDLHRRIDARRGYVLSRLMSGFDQDERVVLADLMNRFVHALDEVVKDLPHCTK